MLNDNIYFMLGLPCSGKTTVGNILAKKYNMFYFSGDNRRFDYFKLADSSKHPYMTKDTSNFYEWSIKDMIEWEKGVISEQTSFILSDLNNLSGNYDLILFDGILDLSLISQIVNKKRVVYLTVSKEIIKNEFFNRDDHKPLLNSILSTTNITLEEKERRINLRKEVACNSFCDDTSVYGIKQFMRDERTSLVEMSHKIESHFELYK